MKNKIIFKTLMLKGEAGSTIVSMEKTGHVGTADIYTITFNDGSTTEISLENMSAITSVEKTSSTDTEDIYTITCADGSTQTFSVLNHNADIAAMSDDIDVMDARLDNFLATQTGVSNGTLRTETTLFSSTVPSMGNDENNSGYFDLEDSVDNYDEIVIRYSAFSGNSAVVTIKPDDIPAAGGSGSPLHWSEIEPNNQITVDAQNGDRSVHRFMSFTAYKFTDVDRISIDAFVWGWNGSANSNGVVSSSFTETWNSTNGAWQTSGFIGGIYSITGIKYEEAGTSKDPELADMRVGADGTTYNSAGAAVRGQISDLKEDLNIVSDGLDDEIARAQAEEARIEALFTADVSEAVSDWLDEHPEATTTVQDGSLTDAKFTNALKLKTIKDYVTPEMFGAVGDGETDDTVAVTEALQHSVVLLTGTYVVTETITVLSVHVYGSGKIISSDNFAVFSNFVKIENITINSASATTAIELNAGGIIDGVTIDGGIVGILIDDTDEDAQVSIVNCNLQNFTGVGAAAIDSQSCNDLIVDNCNISNVTNSGDQDADGIRIWHRKTDTNANAIINSCKINSCKGRFVKGVTSNITVTNCIMYNASDFAVMTYANGIDIQRGNAYIANNTIVAKSPIVISLRDTDHKIIIDGNTLECTHANRQAVAFAYYEDENQDLDCLIANNTFKTVNDRYPISLQGGTGDMRYIIDNNVSNAANYLLYWQNWNENVRVEVTRTSRPNTAPYELVNKSLITDAFNLYSDLSSGQFMLNGSVAFSDLKPNTVLLGKVSDSSDPDEVFLIECRKFATSYKHYILSNSFYFRVYNVSGTKIIGN